MSKKNNKNKNKTNNIIKNIIFVFSFFFIFFIYDLLLRLSICNINTSHNVFNFLSFGFDLFFILIFFIVLNLINQFVSKRIAKLYLLLLYIGFFIVFIINYFILKIKQVPLSLSLLFFKDEGLSFVNFIFDEINISLLLFLIIIIFILIFSFKLFNSYSDSYKLYKGKSIIFYSILILFTIIIYVSIRFNLSEQSTLYSSSRRYYDTVNDSIDSYVVLGLYEFINRDLVLYYSEKYNNNDNKYNKNAIKEITNYLSNLDRNDEDNDMTGIFKDKNLVMIMLESMDNFVINDRVSPNLFSIRNNGWNFSNRFNYLSAGGSTISTEFSTMSGMFILSSYMYKDYYPQSIPAVFNKNGYKTNFMHQNTGDFYKRNILYKNEYFQNSYFLLDIDSNIDFNNDLVMVDNDKYYDYIIPKDGNKFMSFIITYSAHAPYSQPGYEECIGLNKTECFETLASMTDNFVGRLIERLDEDNLLDNTVLVFFTDHQAYAFDYPKNYLDSLEKIDDEKNIKRIPFMIYSTDIHHEDYNMLVNDIDFPPTIFNLFGIDYDPNYYLGTDIFSKNHKNLVMFNNFLWYDGKSYGSSLSYDNYEYTYNMFETSDMMIKNNYYYKMNKKKK